MDDMGIEQARQALGEIVDRARWENEATRILRHGQRWAVVVSDHWYNAATELASLVDLILEDKDSGQEWQSGMSALREARRKAGTPADYLSKAIRHKDGDISNNEVTDLGGDER